MDKTKLKKLLKPFQIKCAEKGKPLVNLCIDDAYPGDISTSYIVQVKANWIDQTDCSEAIDFLFDILWETTSEEVRKKIFSINVLDSRAELHCSSLESVSLVKV